MNDDMARLTRLLDAHVHGYGINVEHGRDIPLLCASLLLARQEIEKARKAAITPTRTGDPEWHYGFRAGPNNTLLHVVEGNVERAAWDRLREARDVLEWLDRHGGLGLEKHARIRAILDS